jgi:hypothetical protein
MQVVGLKIVLLADLSRGSPQQQKDQRSKGNNPWEDVQHFALFSVGRTNLEKQSRQAVTELDAEP